MINNGWTSNWIDFKKGLRQGDCFSPPAFLLVVAILGHKIRNNPHIKGINICTMNKKHLQFADDLWASLMAGQGCLDAFFDMVDRFTDVSGLKLNYDKTQIMRLGSLKDSDAKLFTQKAVSWSRRVKILGVHLSPDRAFIIKENYELLLKKINRILSNRQTRDLTIVGKITVINTLIASQLVYCYTNLYSPAAHTFSQINQMIKEFLWGHNKAKIKYETLQRNYDKGGLKMVKVEAKEISLKVKWIKKALETNCIWSLHTGEVFPIPLLDIVNCNLNKKDVQEMESNAVVSIWYDILKAWSVFNYKTIQQVVDKGLVLEQSLWLNSHIKIDRRVILYCNYFDRGIKTIKEIINLQTGKFFTWEEIKNQYNLQSSYLDYHSLIASIPKQWKKVILQINWNEQKEYEVSPKNGELLLTTKNVNQKIYWSVIEDKGAIDPGKIIWEKSYVLV